MNIGNELLNIMSKEIYAHLNSSGEFNRICRLIVDNNATDVRFVCVAGDSPGNLRNQGATGYPATSLRTETLLRIHLKCPL